jgi:hypothetical protein
MADVSGMDSTTRVAMETRKAMMAVATVTWEDEDETVHSARAKIEDTSASGACFRVKMPIRAGTRVEVSWCRDDFSGMTKWCREDDGEFVVGMQRDRIANKALAKMAPKAQTLGARQVDAAPARRVDIPRVREADRSGAREAGRPDLREVESPNLREMQQEMQHEARQQVQRELQREVHGEVHREVREEVHQAARPINPPAAAALTTGISARRPLIRRGTLIPIPRTVPLPLLRITFPAPVIREPVIGFEIAFDNSARQATNREATDSSAQYQKRTTSFFEERTEMPNKWLNLGSKGQQKDGTNGGGGIGAAHFSPGMAGDTSLAPPRGDLLLLEDIYRTAGIMEPRMGYSITKVVEMLRSDHLRGLGDEVKRASVLMALNAAGVPLGDILQDAAQRQAAVAAYEVEQRKKFEEYWSRRAEENSVLQTEMERVTRQYVERMNRNLTEVQQEKEAFQKWQTAMQHEVLRISEAVTLCAQPAVYESSNEQPAGGGDQSLVAKSA